MLARLVLPCALGLAVLAGVQISLAQNPVQAIDSTEDAQAAFNNAEAQGKDARARAEALEAKAASASAAADKTAQEGAALAARVQAGQRPTLQVGLQRARRQRQRDVVMGEDGLATGELREFEAFAPVIALGGEARLNLGIATGGEPDPWPSAAERAIDKDKIEAGLRHCASHGITSMVNMDGNMYTLALLGELRDEGRLTARVKVPFHFKPHMALSELDRASAMTAEYDNDWLSSGFVKMFMDGVVDSRTVPASSMPMSSVADSSCRCLSTCNF